MVNPPPLGELLATLGISGDRFARRLNASAEALGRTERVHPKTPYKWIKGETPRPPWRSLAALVLSQELSRPITVADLGWPPDDLDCAPATAGLQTPWTPAFHALTSGCSPSSGDPGWSYWMDPAQAHAQAGYCHLRIGDHTQARYHLRRALRLQGTGYTREGALRQILLATTDLQQPRPDIDSALAHAGLAIDVLGGQVDSTRCRGHLARLTQSLAPYHRSPKVREFLDSTRPLLNAPT